MLPVREEFAPRADYRRVIVGGEMIAEPAWRHDRVVIEARRNVTLHLGQSCVARTAGSGKLVVLDRRYVRTKATHAREQGRIPVDDNEYLGHKRYLRTQRVDARQQTLGTSVVVRRNHDGRTNQRAAPERRSVLARAARRHDARGGDS